MQLSTKGRYAVMAMADLAEYGGDTAMPLAMIADRQHISIAYLEQLFMKLRRAGLVKAIRGPKGGYMLAKPSEEISIGEIMNAADEGVQMNRCSIEGAEWCLGTKRCMTHDLWRALGDHISGFLADASLKDVLEGRFTKAAMKKAAAVKPTDQDVAAN
ncbi:MAG: Rrf2 family transcriptional regulator [Rhodomicrobiaceae bacterium]